MGKSFIPSILVLLLLFLSGCGGLGLLFLNTGGTVMGNAIWHKIKEVYPETFPDSVEKINDDERTELTKKLNEINDRYMQLINELNK